MVQVSYNGFKKVPHGCIARAVAFWKMDGNGGYSVDYRIEEEDRYDFGQYVETQLSQLDTEDDASKIDAELNLLCDSEVSKEAHVVLAKAFLNIWWLESRHHIVANHNNGVVWQLMNENRTITINYPSDCVCRTEQPSHERITSPMLSSLPLRVTL